MKYVYKAIVNTRTIDAFDTTEYLVWPEDIELGLYSNRKKAFDAIIDYIDEAIKPEKILKNKMEVSIYNRNDYDICCRVEQYGSIEWYMGKVERIKVY